MPRAYARKKRKRSGWATQRATMQSIPRLTFKPMQVMRRSDLRLTCKINFGDFVGSAGWMSAHDTNANWFFTINANSIFPIFRATNPNDPFDGTSYKVGNPNPPPQPADPNYIGSNTMVQTVWEPSAGVDGSPSPLPNNGMTLQDMHTRLIGADTPNPIYPTCAPGLFEEDSSVGFQYAEIGVLGTKVTMHWVPLVSDLDTVTNDAPGEGTIDGMQTEESRLFAFMHTQGQGSIGPIPQTQPANWGTPNNFVQKDSKWENDISLLSYVKARTITGLTGRTAHGKASVNKLGNGAVLEYKMSPGAIHGTTVRDEKQLWSRNTTGIPTSSDPTVAKFQHPVQRDFLTIGITKSLSAGQKRCPPSGKLEIRIEQLLHCRQPISTRTQLMAQQAPAAGAAGPNPGGGGSFFPGNAFSAGRIGVNVAAAAALAANFT